VRLDESPFSVAAARGWIHSACFRLPGPALIEVHILPGDVGRVGSIDW